MSTLRRTISSRMSRRSYKTLPPQNKTTSLPEGRGESSDTLQHVEEGKLPQASHSTSAPIAAKSEATRKSLKQRAFPSLNTVKSALSNVKQKVTGSQMRKVRLGNTKSVTNAAYVTPRRSGRIKAKSSPSPLSLKMYSPFCIETPGMEDSFVRISKRKALTEMNESPLTKTPRRMVKAAVAGHKELAKSLSSTQVTAVSSNGY